MADIDRYDTTDPDDLRSDDLQESDEVAKTRAEIEQTRGDMAETLNAIKDKLDPKGLMDEAKVRVEEITSNLAEKAKDTVHSIAEDVTSHAKEAGHNAVSGVLDEAKDAVGNVAHATQETIGGVMDTAKGAGSSVLDMVKNNPIPSALIALGAAWLYMKKRDEDSASRYDRYRSNGYRYDYATDSYRSEPANFVDKAKDAVGDAASAVKDKAGDVIDSAKDAVGGAMGNARSASISFIETVERNPIPAAATALGIAWLLLKHQDDNVGFRSRSNSYGYNEWDDRYRPSNGSGSPLDAVKDKAGQVGEAVGDAVDNVKQKAGEVGDAIGGAVDTAKDKAGQFADQARQRAGEWKSQAGGTFSRALQENPLPVGMVALGIGAAVGLMIPESPQEHRLMGETRDRFVEQVQGKAQEVTEKVKTVAGQAMDAAKDTAQNVARDQGLTPDPTQHIARDQGVTSESVDSF